MALYAYCLLRAPANEPLPALRGVGARPVFPFRCEKYTMLVSRVERQFPFTARSIVEHGQVISKMFENHTILPMRFGTFFRSEQQISELIRENRQELLESLARLRGKAEMRLKLCLDGAPAPSLRQPPQRMPAGLVRPDSEGLDAPARELTERVAEQLREALRPVDQQVSCRRVGSEQLMLDLAHLIEAARVPDYQKLATQAAEQLKDFTLRLSGPWPPYHFMPSSVRLPAPTIMPPRTRLAALTR